MNGMEQTTSKARFEFGANWTNFLTTLNDERIAAAEQSLIGWLGKSELSGLRFLDVGSGSGLFSLCARRLGAKVHSFDFDPKSVACTQELRRRYFPDDPDWIVERGDALDATYLADRVGQHDVVYSWGVLHHTGDMWRALANVASKVSPGGVLFISLYNDQGRMSRIWKALKRTYVSLPSFMRTPYVVAVAMPRELRSLAFHLLIGRPQDYFRPRLNYGDNRGMSFWHDRVDWIGGYPFEVSKPEQVHEFIQSRGFWLKRLKTCGGGSGCNEYLFVRARP